MRLPDTNVLVHAVNADAPQHAAALASLTQALEAPQGVGMTWAALIGFIRLSTRPGIFPAPLSVETALRVVDQWLGQPSVRILQPGARHAALLGRFLLGAGVAGNLTNDAHLAALAVEHGATLISFDRDFHRFPGLDFKHLQ